MRLPALFRALLASSLRQPATLFFAVLIIAVSIAAAGEAGDSEGLPIAVVLEDHSEAEARLLSALSESDTFRVEILSREEALALLKKGKVEAVAVILDGFSEKVAAMDFKNSIELYTSPSTSAAATVTEPLINGILVLWLEELAVRRTGGYLTDSGLIYSEADEAEQREKITELWESGSVVQIVNTRTEGDASVELEATSSPLADYTKWFGILCLFYLVISARWAQDFGKRALIVRIEQTGSRLWQVILVSAATPALISFVAYLVGGVVVCIAFGCPISQLFAGLLSMGVYLCGLAGVTLTLASSCRSMVALMFLAPVATFFNGALCGLFVDLPPWAYVLERVSMVLPGRWLAMSALSEGGAALLGGTALSSGTALLGGAALLGGTLCAAAWIALGIATAWVRKHRRA